MNCSNTTLGDIQVRIEMNAQFRYGCELRFDQTIEIVVSGGFVKRQFIIGLINISDNMNIFCRLGSVLIKRVNYFCKRY